MNASIAWSPLQEQTARVEEHAPIKGVNLEEQGLRKVPQVVKLLEEERHEMMSKCRRG